jgi:mRNA interferase MazF
MRRGDLVRRGSVVTVSLRGDAGKPRPALVVQAEHLFAALPTIVVLPLTTSLAGTPLTRVAMEPSEANGLRESSEVMVSRPQSARREQVGQVIGQAEAAVMLEVGRNLALLLGL